MMVDKLGRKISIMGIVNLTDDSFYAGSRVLSEGGVFDPDHFLDVVSVMISEGADILDMGACSTRPGSDSVGEDIEWARLEPALRLLAAERPGVGLSIDTFRPGIVSRSYDIVGPFIVNDVSGGSEAMWKTVGELGLEYVAMHTRGTPKDMQSLTDYEDIVRDVKSFFLDIAMSADRFGVNNWPARVFCISHWESHPRRLCRPPVPRIFWLFRTEPLSSVSTTSPPPARQSPSSPILRGMVLLPQNPCHPRHCKRGDRSEASGGAAKRRFGGRSTTPRMD